MKRIKFVKKKKKKNVRNSPLTPSQYGKKIYMKYPKQSNPT